MIKKFNKFNEKIEIAVKPFTHPEFGGVEWSERNIEHLAKKYGMTLIDGDKHTPEYYIFDVDDDKAKEVLARLNQIEGIEYAGVHDEQLREFWDKKELIEDLLTDLEDTYTHLEFNKEKYDTILSEIGKEVQKLKKFSK